MASAKHRSCQTSSRVFSRFADESLVPLTSFQSVNVNSNRLTSADVSAAPLKSDHDQPVFVLKRVASCA